ncbi:MAG: hypothetical protein JXI43_07840, partial [Tissierellales bacterium]|nr:hypothetical protein [Tissierellales bacterium]
HEERNRKLNVSCFVRFVVPSCSVDHGPSTVDFLFLHLAQIAEIEVCGYDVVENMTFHTAASPAVNMSQEKSSMITMEWPTSTNQVNLTTPGKPAVSFE